MLVPELVYLIRMLEQREQAQPGSASNQDVIVACAWTVKVDNVSSSLDVVY